MKSILLVLLTLLLALTPGSGFAQEPVTNTTVRLRATSISQRHADDTWGPDKEFGGIYIIKSSDNSLVFRRGETIINWYMSNFEDMGLDPQGHQCYRLMVVDKNGELNTIIIKIFKDGNRQIYFLEHGRATLCVQTEVI